MAGEWFFADLLFPGQIPPPHEFADDILRPVTPADILTGIDGARAARAAFIESAVERLAALRPKVVGFTTTFHQTCACLAIAKRLKQIPDPPIVVFGGANCEGVMGLQLLESFPWIDYICTREGDLVFPAFIDRLLNQGDASPLPGLLKQGVSHEVSYPPVVESLDALPIPDYTDYFEQLAACAISADIKPNVLIETSRGCWWGAKHHCTFCGLNGDTMGFRAKSPRRVVDELLYLRERYGVTRIDSVDNILDLRYATQVFPELKRRGSDIEMFYEVKANLKYQHLASMYSGGVRFIQPGIESFSDQVLDLMRKGVGAFKTSSFYDGVRKSASSPPGISWPDSPARVRPNTSGPPASCPCSCISNRPPAAPPSVLTASALSLCVPKSSACVEFAPRTPITTCFPSAAAN